MSRRSESPWGRDADGRARAAAWVKACAAALALVVNVGWTWPWQKATLADVYARARELTAAFGALPTVRPDAFRAAADREAVVFVDNRAREEYEVSHLPGAVYVADFEAHAEEYRHRRVVIYCTIGYRSAQLTRRYLDLGFRVANMEGGILAWAFEGLPLVDEEGSTKRVHTYNRSFNLVPRGYEAVW